MTLTGLTKRFPTEDDCKTFLTQLRWPDGNVKCPACGATKKVYALKARPHHWVCKNHPKAYRFSVLKGTMYENTNIKLVVWFQAIALVCNAKKGISARQLQRDLGLKSYESAWYLYHRIRGAMKNDEFDDLTGTVEVDETFIGGHARNAHKGNRGASTKAKEGKRGNLIPPKAAVIGAIARKGSIVAKVIEETDRHTLHNFVRTVVADDVELVATDQHPGYDNLERAGIPHESVNHQEGEYVRGVVHTANIDSFWSLLKRGIVGNFHHVSKDYLPLYLAEFTFKHNHRKDGDMFTTVCAG